jgi:glyoxylase-like metal-dependent hydrolase (beta-lactamase superfamily II)
MNIVNVGYDSTNYYALDIKGGKLLVDCGWPGTLPKFTAELKRKGIGTRDIRYVLVTHFHPDHAGLVQEVKDMGAKLLLMESQPDFIAPMAEMLRKKGVPYVELRPQGNLLLMFKESRKFLAGLGIAGEVIPTPGHSDDSVTLILDEGYAFTGDLYPRFMLSEEDVRSQASWDRIYEHKITRIFPAHGESRG